MNLRPYWWDTVSDSFAAPERGAAPPPARCDVLVVGAGYTGLSAARRLARRGVSVLVVDRQAAGWGASSRNGGQVLTGLKLAPAALVARYGARRAAALFEAANAAIANLSASIRADRIDCDYRQCGHVQAAWKPSHFDALRAEQSLLARVFKHRVEIVSRSDQRAELGSGRYHGLLVDEQSGCLNPARYVRGLAETVRRAGGCIAAGTAVERIDRTGHDWQVALTSGSIEAADVLIATNGYADAAAPAIRRRMVPIGSYVIATEPLHPEQAATLLPKGRTAFDTKHFLYYFRVTRDLRLLFGGRAEFSRDADAAVVRAAGILHRGMCALFPELSGVKVDYAWGGHVAFTRDQMPHAGRIDDLYFAGGYCGHGIAIATELGDLVARRICGEVVSNPLLDMACPAIPFYRGAPWLLPLVGAYYKVKDWIS